MASRIGPAQARAAAVLLLTLRGTPTLFYGDELGLEDVEVPPDRVQDPWERRVPGRGLGRDPVRTPMPWDRGPNAGFAPAAATPWLPQPPDAGERSVAAQREDPGSLLALYRALLALRRAEPALHAGDHRTLGVDGDVLVFERSAGPDRLVVALNLGADEAEADLGGGGEVAPATDRARDGERLTRRVRLGGGAAVVVRRA